ncbi:MAG: hypothetical protein M1821_003485 [Bathelium mastoideum]|nr:MAG: hypothetical protein M1821_003485 [Bathelium mastoideum]
MLRTTVVNTLNFFYPLGNTPAVCLTQDLAPEQSATILLLGCGDVRNVLFTTFADPGKHIDVTCCDIEPAILARNVLLFTLLIDDDKNQNLEQIWDIYYHLRLGKKSFDLLQQQARKLLNLLESLERWTNGTYGHALRFCDTRTVARLRTIYEGYCLPQSTPEAEKSWREQLELMFEKAKRTKKDIVGESSITMTGVRSAAPAGIKAIQDYPMVTERWWKSGVAIQNPRDSSPEVPNPTFLISLNQALTLHYGLEPLHGFPSAICYVPLTSASTLRLPDKTPSAERLASSARLQFRVWSDSFRKAISDRCVLRFCSADALAFCHTLQGEGCTAHLACDNWTFDPLVLDSGEYHSRNEASCAPARFSVIDTSNLLDHLGPLNMLTATAPLLEPGTSSTLFTEMLVQDKTSNARERVANLGADLRTLALLFGLAPIGLWTNATATSEADEGMLEAAMGSRDSARLGGVGRSTQSRTRLQWKHLPNHPALGLSSIGPKNFLDLRISVNTPQLVQTLFQIYKTMFQHEDIMGLMSNLELRHLSKTANPYYNRASLAALLKYLRSQVIAEWESVIISLLSRIEEDFSPMSLCGNYAQELYLYFHLAGLSTVDTLIESKLEALTKNPSPWLSSWNSKPSLVCITMEVPRAHLRPLTEALLETRGSPSLCMNVTSSRASAVQWSNSFSVIQGGFGTIKMFGRTEKGSLQLEVVGDPSCWGGTSKLIISFFIPTWILYQEPTTAVVSCGLQPTAYATMAYKQTLGLELCIFTTTLADRSNLHVTEHMPNMTALPNLEAGVSRETASSPSSKVFQQSVTAEISGSDTYVTALTNRITCFSEAWKDKLANKANAVQVQFKTPLTADIIIGRELWCQMHFPSPVASSQRKVRIARKSSYIEVLAPLWQPLGADNASFVFPIFVPEKLRDGSISPPINYNLPWINLDVLPTIDISAPQKIDWLVTHVSLAMSSRERKMREAGIAGKLPPGTQVDTRVDMKDGLFSLFMHYSGLQGQKSDTFGLWKDVGGVQLIILPSALKLDLINHTVILDCAVVPLTELTMRDAKVQRFCASLQPLMQINVTHDELIMWKSILPALAERCRSWKHQAACEYLSKFSVPVPEFEKDSRTPLCSCGIGQFLKGFLKIPRLQHLEYVLKKYATRAAISPIFAIPYVEDCFGFVNDKIKENEGPDKLVQKIANGGCFTCGRDRKKNATGDSAELLTCSRCKIARYCSAECQKKDWKDHKRLCTTS